jgi:signal transduction histidine kinase
MATSAAPPLIGDPGFVRSPPRPFVLWAIALAGVAAAACAALLALTSDHVREPGVHAALQVWPLLGYVLAGVVAWWRRPESRFALLMVFAGVVWFLTSLSSANVALPYTVGIAFDLLPAVVFLHVFLAFPSGRLEGRFERALVIAGYVTALAAQLVGMALDGFGPDNLLAVTSEPDAALWLLRVQLVILSATSLAGIVVLAVRRRDAGPPLRRSLALVVDSFALALVMIAVLLLSSVFGLYTGQLEFETIRRATFFALGLAPFAFLVGLVHARLAQSAVGDLVVELRADPAPADLRDALARALRDPSLTLAYWLPDFRSYADLEGRPVKVPAQDGLATTVIDREGEQVAVLLHDRALEEEPELLAGVGAAASIALENARLQAEVAARLEELKGSRARVIEAGQRERQRLERDLHDGAQQRLIALSLELRALEKRLSDDPDATKRLGEAQAEITRSLDELRSVARGIHPAVLTGHGLAVALEQVTTLACVPVRLKVAIDGRLPGPIEIAAYYVVTESLANVAKHARAATASVEVRWTAEGLLVEIVDDGVGGADSERGTGLRGLADRVEALGGRLRVWTPQGGGTRVKAEIPCA